MAAEVEKYGLPTLGTNKETQVFLGRAEPVVLAIKRYG